MLNHAYNSTLIALLTTSDYLPSAIGPNYLPILCWEVSDIVVEYTYLPQNPILIIKAPILALCSKPQAMTLVSHRALEEDRRKAFGGI